MGVFDFNLVHQHEAQVPKVLQDQLQWVNLEVFLTSELQQGGTPHLHVSWQRVSVISTDQHPLESPAESRADRHLVM